MAGDLFLVLGRGSPIGIGIFLALLGSTVFLLAKADQTSKGTKAFEKGKEIEKNGAGTTRVSMLAMVAGKGTNQTWLHLLVLNNYINKYNLIIYTGGNLCKNELSISCY